MAWWNKKSHNLEQSKRTLQLISDDSSFGYVESYKALRTNLEYVLEQGQHGRVLLVTSSVPAEGKSNVSTNLALTMAQNGKRVVLLDCDLRKGTLHRYLHIPRQTAGVANVLTGEVDWEKAITPMTDLGISVMTAGFLPPNPTELLASAKMRNLLNTLSKSFDYVLCDTPPVNAVTDTSILCRYTDGVILVISHNMVKRDIVLAAKKQLESVNATILGTVLNMYDAKNAGTDGSKYYYYYYNYDYHGGGYGQNPKHSSS